ncbi:hypothetical protein LCGC14_1593020 [marine sediment metagenome]|uniref:Exonuclease domain-containing protein n=1 Tax=marine sediment metagenome TaxID=412755 RepID=A0A0F9LDW8_9ZZZZ
MKDKKLFFVDVETTGIDSIKNDIIQLGGLIEINGKIVEEINFTCQPFNYNTINATSLEINKTTIEELKTYQAPQTAHNNLKQILEKYVDKYDKNDKFSPVGYNVGFDVDFLRQFFFKNYDKYYGSLIDYHKLDVFGLVFILEFKGLIKLENYKLVTVAKYFGIEYEEHDALEDIKVTREVFYKMLEYLK